MSEFLDKVKTYSWILN